MSMAGMDDRKDWRAKENRRREDPVREIIACGIKTFTKRHQRGDG